MPPAAGLGCSELELRSKSTCAQQDFEFLLPSLCSTRQVCVFLITLSAKLLLLITRHSHFSPSSPHLTAMKAQCNHHGLQRWEVGQEGRAEAAPCRILAPAKGLLPGSFPSAQPGVCNSHAHRFPLATANRGQVRRRTALISYKLILIIIIMKGCMNTKFASFAVVFTKDRLAR